MKGREPSDHVVKPAFRQIQGGSVFLTGRRAVLLSPSSAPPPPAAMPLAHDPAKSCCCCFFRIETHTEAVGATSR